MSTSISEKGAEQLKKEDSSRFQRAAEISIYVTSTTIGPNSSYKEIDDKSGVMKENRSNNKSPGKDSQYEQVVDKFSKMDFNDFKCFQKKIHDQSRDKEIEIQVRKKLEEKRAKEMEEYAKIKSKIDLMRIEAEKKHQMKMQAFERQIQLELEKERQKELAYQEQKKALAANTKKIQEEKERQLKEQIRKFDDVFNKQEAVFLKIIQSCNPEMAPSLDSFKKQLKDIKNLKDTQKNSLEGTKSCCMKLDALCQKLQKEMKDFEEVLQAKKAQKEEEEQKLAEAAQQKQEVIVPKQIVAIQPRSHEQVEQLPLNESHSVRNEFSRIFNEYRQLLSTKKEQTKNLDEKPELQQIRFALKFAINNAVNLLNENNRTTLIDGYQKLFKLLSGQPVSTPKGTIKITDHNEASDWCKLRICEKLIDRCDKDVTLVFYVAALTISLWQKFPDFGEIFKATLFKESPFFLPYIPPKLKTQSTADFLTSWGFRLNDGVCENHDHYEIRTTKFSALLGALWISFPRKGENQVSPFDIKFGWMYFANILNSHPDANYLHIIGKLLEVCGFMLHQVYGKQFVKIMLMIRDMYIPAVHQTVDEETSASFNRLRETVNKFFTENKFDEPKGRLINGYW